MVSKYQLFGTISPDTPRWDFGWSAADVRARDFPTSFSLSVKFLDSAVSAEATFADDSVVMDLPTLRNTVEAIIRTHVDCFGFLQGCGLHFFVDKVILPTGEETFFNGCIPDLVNQKNDLFYANRLFDLMELAGQSWHLSNALCSFRLAIEEQ